MKTEYYMEITKNSAIKGVISKTGKINIRPSSEEYIYKAFENAGWVVVHLVPLTYSTAH